jgi:hypothetical protein
MPIMTIEEIQAKQEAWLEENGHAISVRSTAVLAAGNSAFGTALRVFAENEREGQQLVAAEALHPERAEREAMEYSHQQLLRLWQRLDTARAELAAATEQAWQAIRQVEGDEAVLGDSWDGGVGEIARIVIEAEWGILSDIVGAKRHQTVTREWFGPIELHPNPKAVLTSTSVLPEDRHSISGWEQM